MSRILLIEDNRGYAETLQGNLEVEGYEVLLAGTGADGLALARTESPDLIILDLMLPTMNGFTVLQRLRESGRDTPVLIMTALGAEDEKLRGFGLGADDYVVKPTGLLEILARVKALLKRSTGGASEIREAVRIADIEVDLSARVVRRAGAELPVRPKEFDLLAALIRHRGKVVSKLRVGDGIPDGGHARRGAATAPRRRPTGTAIRRDRARRRLSYRLRGCSTRPGDEP
jgi:two-component system, OmpR family, response regulator